jgi:hypothetical protein
MDATVTQAFQVQSPCILKSHAGDEKGMRLARCTSTSHSPKLGSLLSVTMSFGIKSSLGRQKPVPWPLIAPRQLRIPGHADQ